MATDTFEEAGPSLTRLNSFMPENSEKVISSPHEGSCVGEKRSFGKISEDTEKDTGKLVRISSQAYSNNVRTNLYQLYLEAKLCDVTLVVRGFQVHAHKIVLASQSCMLKGLFTTDMAERNMASIDLSHLCDRQNLSLLLKYMYTGNVDVESTNLQDLLAAADALGVMGCYSLCVQFLADQLDTQNCIEMIEYAHHIGCKELFSRSKAMITANLADVVKTEQYCNIRLDLLCEVLADADIEVDSEWEVWEYIQIWISADKTARKGSLGEIAKRSLRLHNMTQDELQQVCRDISVDAVLFQMALQAAMSYMGASDTEKLEMVKTGKVLPPRKQRIKPAIWCVGGTDNTKFRETLLCYSLEKRTWEERSAMKHARCGFGVAHMNGFLYALGGKSTSAGKSMDSVEKYDIENDTWTECAPMKTPRRYHGVAALNGLIYAIGGGNGSETLRSVECYDPRTDTWTECAPLTEGRKCVSAAVLNGKIYAIGGFSQRTLRSVEAYDPATNTWEMKGRLLMKRQFHGCCVLDGHIYAVGGNGYGRTTIVEVGEHSVERYNPETDSWSQVAPMKIPRAFLGVAVMDGCIYTLGGHSQAPPTPNQPNSGLRHVMVSVERYDPSLDKWTVLTGDALPEPRSAAGCIGVGV